MPINVTLDKTTKKANIKLEGRFDISKNREFKNACDQITNQEGGVKYIDLDFSDVSYVDSSALGMLLLLRRSTEPNGMELALVNTHGPVRQILEVSNFHKLFTLR
jgi:anti-anti-sigma factor